jgi:putative transposase
MFHRKNIRLPAECYRGQRWFFVTVCCHERQPLLSDDTTSLEILSCLAAVSTAREFNIHAYCLMPDHLHFLAEGRTESSDLLEFVIDFKQQTSFDWQKRSAFPLWQKKYYDHVLRRVGSIDAIAWYIWMNPVRKGICEDPHKYLLSGSLTGLWKNGVRPSEAWIPPWKNAAIAKRKMPG